MEVIENEGFVKHLLVCFLSSSKNITFKSDTMLPLYFIHVLKKTKISGLTVLHKVIYGFCLWYAYFS